MHCAKNALCKSIRLFARIREYKITMQKLTFITGNEGKFLEVATVLAPIEVEKLHIELPEIQSIDAEEILKYKLRAAEAHAPGSYIIEDTSLYFDCLGGKLPGPLIKWFEKGIENDGLADLVSRYQDKGALFRCLVGHINKEGKEHFFSGDIRLNIVAPRGEKGWGLDPILEVSETGKTFGEMTHEEKMMVSNRGIAIRKLKEFLLSEDK